MAEGLDPVSIEKLEAAKKFKRFQSWKKSMRYFVLCSVPRFLFLLSNVIIMSLAAKSGLLNPTDGGAELYEEFVRRSKTARKYYVSRPVLAEEKAVAREATVPGSSQAKYGRSKSEIVKRTARQSDGKLQRSESEQTARRRRNLEKAALNDGQEAAGANEELNRRVEEFIAKFQREIRLQGQQSLVRY